jgi:hypothetical protein
MWWRIDLINNVWIYVRKWEKWNFNGKWQNIIVINLFKFCW